jgi:hypothetical protein
MISLAARPIAFRPVLGQLALKNTGLLVSVVDRQGKPVPNAQVRAFQGAQEIASGTTNSGGDVELPVTSGPVDLAVNYNGHALWKEASAKSIARNETIVVDFPFCVRDPILKPMDIGLLLTAGALAGAGVYWKIEPVKVAGEVIFGASMFTIIYRLSCL